MATVPLPSLSDAIDPVAAALDALSHDERINWMRGLSRKELSSTWELTAGRLVDYAYFASEPGETVIHHGQNSLPAFNAFQKRFHRRTDDHERPLQGYNHNPGFVGWFSGPGHYTCTVMGGTTVIDYTVMPPDVPAEFPDLIDNNGGARKLVYGGMQDHMRRVSRHCTIGRAYKDGKEFGAWFMLTREGEPDDAETYAEGFGAGGDD